ncbi:hypothetical protein RMCBS344292_13583 [Rhizopus microsporus]|nr:hypothetical protein RMCBS344292_13583 [Rhizopus microsporus]
MNNRILDIHYSDRSIVALFVHTDYVSELCKQLGRFKVTLKDDSDPCDPKVLRDPKCVILDNSTDPITYTLYDQPLPRGTTFAYLGVPFKPGGYLDPEELIQRNTCKALATMNMLSSVGVNPSGFSKLLCTRFYAHIIRFQLEYGLAINRFTVSQLHTLEEAQNNCIKKIYGARGKASTKVMFRMSKLPLHV